MLAESVQEGLEELGLSAPTEPQLQAIPHLLKGENVLLIAPNGSGKTEAALLPILSRITRVSERPGISILYITPLRALNRDMIGRVSFWSAKLNLSVHVRHGDTEAKVRRKQALSPPDILITTPETLQAILPGSRMKTHLQNVRCVIIDEVHHFASDKRGAQLSVALERLDELVQAGFQRIGLSATLENHQKAASFIAGTGRPIRIVEVPLPKAFTYKVEYPKPQDSDYELAHKLNVGPETAARINRMFELTREHKSTLVFVNSRTNAEMLGHRFSQLAKDIAVHHGSLSQEERTRIEEGFKLNNLKALVCTSTMELGIDIGQVDLVIQYLSPRQVASLIQRVGRSGHRLDLTSKGIVIAAFPEDALESLAATRKANRGVLEQLRIHENPLDVVAHQMAGILMDKSEVSLKAILKIFRRAYPFRRLSKSKLIEVAEYLDDLREIRLEGEVLKKTRRTREYYYGNLSMIPDEKRYPIVDILSDRKIGTLGDEFMVLRARIGLSFICRGEVWRIVQIEDETGTVHVVPSEDQFAAVPGWDGEMIPVSWDLAQEVGRMRRKIEREHTSSVDSTIEKLSKQFTVDKEVIAESVKEEDWYRKENLKVPTDKHIVIEAFNKYIVVHTCLGETANRTLGSIFDTLLSDHELIISWWTDGYRILIETPRKVEAPQLDEIAQILFKLTPDSIDKAFKEYIEARFPFSSRMKFIAERFGALPRGRTIGVDKMAELPSRFKDTPIYDETLREAMLEKVDLRTAKRVISDIERGKIKVSKLLRLEAPTPLAYNIFHKYGEAAELMAPEHTILSNLERMKKATMMKSVRLLCLECGRLTKERRVLDFPERPVCNKCGSRLMTKLWRTQSHAQLKGIFKRRTEGEDLTPEELQELTQARRTADLILSYGRKAIAALLVKGVGPETASRILGKMHHNEDDLYLDLLKAKVQYLRTKPFWDKNQAGIFNRETHSPS